MKKKQQSFLARLFTFNKKEQETRAHRDYTALVENFKTKVKID